MWFLPKNWKDVEKAIEDYDPQGWDDYFHLKCFHLPHVNKLVLDPERDLRYGELEEQHRTSPFAEAIKYILNRCEEAPRVILLDEWRKQQLEAYILLHDQLREKSMDVDLFSNGDCFFTYREFLGEDTSITCSVCEEPLTHEAYTCQFCNLGLHKSCAQIIESKVFYEDEHGSYIGPATRYGFPADQLYACKSCIKGGKDFSYECKSCIFQTHLKCRLLPTIVYNDFHQHILSIRLESTTSSDHGMYDCAACGKRGYLCSYFCMICRFNYHTRCAYLPPEVKHEHGGYEHLLKLTFSHEDKEDYWCDFCYKDVDPEHWFYYCQGCPYYVAHVHCALVKPEYAKYRPRMWKYGGSPMEAWGF